MQRESGKHESEMVSTESNINHLQVGVGNIFGTQSSIVTSGDLDMRAKLTSLVTDSQGFNEYNIPGIKSNLNAPAHAQRARMMIRGQNSLQDSTMMANKSPNEHEENQQSERKLQTLNRMSSPHISSHTGKFQQSNSSSRDQAGHILH